MRWSYGPSSNKMVAAYPMAAVHTIKELCNPSKAQVYDGWWTCNWLTCQQVCLSRKRHSYTQNQQRQVAAAVGVTAQCRRRDSHVLQHTEQQQQYHHTRFKQSGIKPHRRSSNPVPHGCGHAPMWSCQTLRQRHHVLARWDKGKWAPPDQTNASGLLIPTKTLNPACHRVNNRCCCVDKATKV
jgi:hypothetical protein